MGLYDGPIVDAHHHLWHFTPDAYPWLIRRGNEALARDIGPAEYRAAAAGLPVVATVWIEALAADPLAEARAAQAFHAADGGLCNAIVAHVPLDAPDAAARLDRLSADVPNLRGIRDIVAARVGWQSLARHPHLLADPAFADGLRQLARRGLSFDLMLEAPQMAEAARLLRIPDLTVIVEHAGGPELDDPADVAIWRRGLDALAALPNVAMKISALHCRMRDWTDAALKPLIVAVVERFGTDRVMFASDFPVHDAACPLRRAYDTFRAATADMSADEQRALFAGTAQRLYRLPNFCRKSQGLSKI
jgi:predicted TIM-barrel fold metal-dependent hydrolase